RSTLMSRRQRLWAATFELCELESRLLYCVEGSDFAGSLPTDGGKNNGSYSLPTKLTSIQVQGPFAGSGTLMANPLSSIPTLNSNSGAAASLYLDFNGSSATSWGS